jgi:hypothetical protein
MVSSMKFAFTIKHLPQKRLKTTIIGYTGNFIRFLAKKNYKNFSRFPWGGFFVIMEKGRGKR